MRKNYKLPFHIKEYIKKELYHYEDNKRLLKDLRNDIIEESPLPSDGQPRGNQTSNLTESKTIRLTSTRAILIAEKKVKQIERALERLVPEEQEIVDKIFNKGHSQIYAQMHDNITKDSYYNAMNKIIYYTAVEYGEI